MDSKALTKTSFCDKQVDNVTNNDVKKHILDDLCNRTGITYKYRYAKMYILTFKRILIISPTVFKNYWITVSSVLFSN